MQRNTGRRQAKAAWQTRRTFVDRISPIPVLFSVVTMNLDHRAQRPRRLWRRLNPSGRWRRVRITARRRTSFATLPFPDEFRTFDRVHQAVFCDHPVNGNRGVLAVKSILRWQSYDFEFALEVVEVGLTRLLSGFCFLVVRLEAGAMRRC